RNPIRHLCRFAAYLGRCHDRTSNLDGEALQLLGNDRHFMLPVFVPSGRGLDKLDIVDEHAAQGTDPTRKVAGVIGEATRAPFRFGMARWAVGPPREQVGRLRDFVLAALCIGGPGAILPPPRDGVIGPSDAASLASQSRDELNRYCSRRDFVGIENEALVWIALQPMQQDV